MWHLYVNGDSNSPYVFEDQHALHSYLSSLASGSIFSVTKFDVIQRETVVYGITGSPPIPSVANPVALEQYTRTHMKAK